MASHDGWSRREFLRSGASFIALAGTVPAFLQQTVEAATRDRGQRAFMAGERILVVIQLAGGNDGLNTIVPVRNDEYYRLRPRLAVPRTGTLRLDDDYGLHGEAAGLKRLHDEGRMAVVHGVGYPNPNRSHFKSTDIWHSASPDGRQHSGWLGRYFDNACGGQSCDPAAGIALTPEAPMALRGEDFLPLAFERAESLAWHAAVRPAATGQVVTAMNQPRPSARGNPENNLEYLRRVALEAQLSAEKIRWATRDRRGGNRIPGGSLGRSLETVASLIAAGMQTRVYYVSQGGYDTHANQARSHGNLLRDLGDAVKAFLDAMAAQGNLDRVLVMTFSEFGRRVAENASQGTDHGAAAPLFLFGSKVRPGLHGTAPDLRQLDGGDLRYATDFRQVYAAVLGDWLRTPPERILGQSFTPLPLVRR